MADVSELITMGIGTPSSIPYFVLMGLGVGTPVPPSTVGGGGARPIRNWDGRQRGNVEVIYRQRTTRLNPEPLVLKLTITAKLTPRPQRKLNKSKPGLPQTPQEVIAKPKPRVWPSLRPRPIVLRLSINGILTRIPPEVTWRARIHEKSEALGVAEQDLVVARALISRLQEEVIELEDELLLGVR